MDNYSIPTEGNAPVPVSLPQLEPVTKKAKKRFSYIGMSLSLQLLIETLIVFYITIIASLIYKNLNTDSELYKYLVSAFAVDFASFLFFYLMMTRYKPEPPVKRNITLGYFILVLIISLAVMQAGAYIGRCVKAVYELIPGVDGSSLNKITGKESILLEILFAVIIAPICEELIYRKVLIDRVRCFGDGVAIAASGVIFGLIHGNFDQFFYAFGVGLIFAYIYIKTGKIKYTIALHMLVNFFGSVVPLALIKVTNIYELEKSTSLSNKLQIQKAIASLIFFLYDIIVLAVVVTGIVLLIVFRKRICISKNAPEPLPEGNKTQIMFINAGMLAFIIISAFVFAGRLCA